LSNTELGCKNGKNSAFSVGKTRFFWFSAAFMFYLGAKIGAAGVLSILLQEKHPNHEFKKTKNMKRLMQIGLLPGLFCLAFTIQLHAQKEVQVESFDQVSAVGSITMHLEAGDANKVVLYIDGIPEKEIEVKVSKGVLRIQVLNGFLYKNEIVKAYVTYKSLRGVRANAGAKVDCKETLSADLFSVSAAAGGQLDLSLNVKNLDASASEGGQLNLKGTATTQEINASTGGVCRCSNLIGEKASVKTSTGGRAEVQVTDLLEAAANVGGEILYENEPKEKRVKQFLGGDVRKMR
jgi:hypothetical protein